jgi:hypothetical protein
VFAGPLFGACFVQVPRSIGIHQFGIHQWSSHDGRIHRSADDRLSAKPSRPGGAWQWGACGDRAAVWRLLPHVAACLERFRLRPMSRDSSKCRTRQNRTEGALAERSGTYAARRVASPGLRRAQIRTWVQRGECNGIRDCSVTAIARLHPGYQPPMCKAALATNAPISVKIRGIWHTAGQRASIGLRSDAWRTVENDEIRRLSYARQSD